MPNRGTQDKNREVVLECILKMPREVFKGKQLRKIIGDRLSRSQVANGIKILRQEGFLERYNDSETWIKTDECKKLKKEKKQ